MHKRIYLFIVLLVLTAIALTGCVPMKNSGAQKKLERKGYSVTIDTQSTPSLIQAKCGTKCSVLYGVRGRDSNFVYAFYFDTKEDASASLDYITEWSARKLSDAKVNQSGKIVYFGTEQGIKDFK